MTERPNLVRGQAYKRGWKGHWRGNRSWRGHWGNFKGHRGGSSSFTGRESRLQNDTSPISGHHAAAALVSFDGKLPVEMESSQRPITDLLPPVHCPYKGWCLYFSENYKENSPTVDLIQAFQGYLVKILPTLPKDEIDRKHSLNVNVKELFADEDIKVKYPELEDMVLHSPQKVMSSLGLAIHHVLTQELQLQLRENTRRVLSSEEADESVIEEATPEANLPKINARLVPLDKQTPLKHLKASSCGKLISVKGTIVRVSSIKPLCTRLAFSCLGCGFVQGLPQPDGCHRSPTSCPQHNCQFRSFTPLHSHKLTLTVDWQTARLQEVFNDDQDGGRIPRVVDCELMEDLVDTCIPGDVVTVTGIVKVSQSEESRIKRSEKSLFLLYIEANSIVNCKSGSDSASALGIEFSLKDYYAIQKIQSEPSLFRLLVASLCPAIYGQEMVKAGLILCLFGGCPKNLSNGVPVRGDPHILVVGDPGLGKSQLLQACCSVAPRGVYVCGNTTTTSGLTVSLSKESSSSRGGQGDYSLEGGALVLADQGACCIDEFDKMKGQQQALLEAMEQQSISIAKAGIVCSLPARTSILAAANPIGGHYYKAKTVSENLKMNGALLSRFDLVFILLDKPDEELDCLLSEHVMGLHSGSQLGTPSSRIRRQDFGTSVDLGSDNDQPLDKRLKWNGDETVDPMPHQLLRKYICYARKYVFPKLSTPAVKVLQQFYLELRQKHQNSDSTPITTRQLESLIRLSEARARCELREDVTEQDARDIVQIMKFSMIDTYSDEFGFLDFQRSQHGASSSKMSQVKKFVSALQRLSDSMYKTLFSLDELRQLSRQINIQVRDFSDFISTLNHHGYLLKKGTNVYQLLTSGS